ncbi:MAG: serine hydrolase domain-containing protein [Parvularculaceae bacterium]
MKIFRKPLAALAAFVGSATATATAGAGARADLDARLAAIVRGAPEAHTGGAVAGAALAVLADGEIVYANAAGCAAFANDGRSCARPLEASAKVRVASISKMALALGLFALVDDGRVALDDDASAHLGRAFRNPRYPDDPITVGQLLSHTSSVRDPEAYWVAAPGDFWTIFEGAAAFAAPAADGASRAPGRYFEYANLNYGVLAMIIENVAGERFDLFMNARVFAPMGLDVGFNWSGVSAPARAAGAPLHRWSTDDERWRETVDDAAMRAGHGPYFLAADDLDRAAYLKSYAPGANATLFSPQGGLRANPADLARLATRAGREPRFVEPVWRADGANGETLDGYFGAFGHGAYYASTEGLGPHAPAGGLVGHGGEAYGLYSGAWAAPEAGLAVGFVVTGTGAMAANRGENAGFTSVEAALMRLAFDAAAATAPAVNGSETPAGEAER